MTCTSLKEMKLAKYAIAFDLDNKQMEADGLTKSSIVSVYQREIPTAFKKAGFDGHLQGSIYHTESEQDQIAILIDLKGILQESAPNFCKYANRIHIFRLEDWSDVTAKLSTKPKADEPSGVEELLEQLFREVNS
jgi:virulence-associated protein VapD